MCAALFLATDNTEDYGAEPVERDTFVLFKSATDYTDRHGFVELRKANMIREIRAIRGCS